MSCIFCKIIAAEAESSKIYEDDDILAFMDVFPVRRGQVLVIPKTHIDHFSDLPEDLATKVFQKAHEISKKARIKLKPERMGLIIHGYGVAHAHIIILPLHDKDDITHANQAKIKDGKVIFTMEDYKMADREELDKLAKELK